MGGEKPSLMLVLVKVCVLIAGNSVFFIFISSPPPLPLLAQSSLKL